MSADGVPIIEVTFVPVPAQRLAGNVFFDEICALAKVFAEHQPSTNRTMPSAAGISAA